MVRSRRIVTMKELKIGDEVEDVDGSFQPVIFFARHWSSTLQSFSDETFLRDHLEIETSDGDKVVMTPKEMEQLQSCKALGGCFVVTQAGLGAMVDKTIEVTLVEIEKSAPICKRGLST